ncbi:MAG: hypothetical protein ACRYFX_24125 [Janthinobacterium lividum]
MKKLYWLYLLTALLAGFSCVMNIRHQRPVLAVLTGLTASLNLVVFWIRRARS